MTSRILSEVGERAWLDQIANLLPAPDDPRCFVPIGDDAVVWRFAGGDTCQVVTSDAQVEGTHFEREWMNWEGLAQRALLAAASDVTAMGGKPSGFATTLGVDPETPLDDVEAFATRLNDLAKEYDLVPLGGDTTRSDLNFVDITVLGSVREEDILRQTGAQEGDAIWVTGTLGGARAAWMLFGKEGKAEKALEDNFWCPPARWPILDGLRSAIEVRAMTDLSDGLKLDLEKCLRTSGLGGQVHLDRLPTDDRTAQYAIASGIDPYELAYAGGEDFELLVFEAGDGSEEPIIDLDGVPLTRIGRVTGNKIQTLLNGNETSIESKPYEHFCDPE